MLLNEGKHGSHNFQATGITLCCYIVLELSKNTLKKLVVLLCHALDAVLLERQCTCPVRFSSTEIGSGAWADRCLAGIVAVVEKLNTVRYVWVSGNASSIAVSD